MSDLESVVLTAHAEARVAPAVISGDTVNIPGGYFTSIAGDQHLSQTTVNIVHAPEQSKEGTVEAVLKILRKHAMVKTWDVHRHVSGTRAPDTGLEFNESEDMELWRGTLRGFIWATGSPGAGKTHLASSVFDRLHTRAKADEDTVVVITYLRYNDETTEWDTVIGLLTHLVESKPLPAVLEVIQAGFAEHEQRNSRPTFQQLSQILRAVVRKYKRCYVIIDGLDESKYEIQMMLVNLLATLDANILLLSRDMQLVRDRLRELRSNRAVFVTVAAHEKDLDRYISHVIDTNPRLARLLADPEVQERLRGIVKTKAQGMFLHVSLQMEALRDCLDVRSIFDVVNEFPTGMDALYLRTLERIDKQPLDHGRRARRVLAWILYAYRPLLLVDVQHAIAVSSDYEIERDRIICEGDLAAICCGLVAVDEKTRRVRLVHETAQHYLGQLLREECPAPHEAMALTCMKLLERAGLTSCSIATVRGLEAAFASTPLLEYAYRSVGHHIREAFTENPPESFLEQVFSFVWNCKSFPYHHPSFDIHHPTMVQRLSPIHASVLLDLPQVLRRLMKEKGVDVNAKSAVACEEGVGWSSLMIACIEGRAEVIPELFSSSQLDASEASCHDGLTPLMVASSQGHVAVVQALVRWNTRVGRVLAGAAKLVGTWSGRRFVDVNGYCVRASGETALIMAAKNGHWRVVEVLVGVPGVDVNLCDQSGKSALVHAAQWGHGGVVRALLGVLGVEVNRCGNDGESALVKASSRGHVEVVKLLLATPGIDVNLCDPNGSSALIRASGKGCVDVVKQLLAVPRVDVNICDKNGNSALIEASRWGLTEVVELLLAAPRVQVNLCAKGGSSALMQASYWGRTEVIKLLLCVPGVDVNLCRRSGTGDSALILAALEGRTEAVELLLAAPEVVVNLRNRFGDTALIRASCEGHTEVVKLLVAAAGVDLELLNGEGKSALQVAQLGRRWEVVKVLEVAISERSLILPLPVPLSFVGLGYFRFV